MSRKNISRHQKKTTPSLKAKQENVFTADQPADEMKYKAIYEQSADAHVIIDVNKSIVHANPAAVKMIGKPFSELKGINIARFLGWTSRKRFVQVFETVLSGSPVIAFDLNLLDKNKKLLPIEVSAATFTLSKNKAVNILLNIRDISEKKVHIQEAHEKEKMQALQLFISGAAHEIHHPIKAFLDQTQRLVKKYSKRHFEYISFREFTDIIHSLERMQDQARYCHETTNRMLSLSKKRVGKIKMSTAVNEIIEKRINTVKHQFEVTDVAFSFRKGRNLEEAGIHENDFDLIMQNIFTNSIQSMPAGGKIEIKTSVNTQKKYIIIECKDNGIGIPDDAMPRVFEPFFTTKHRGLEKSSGLGLSIVYTIVKSYQGDIFIKSTLRKGTTVTIRLPVHNSSGQNLSK